MDTDDSAIKARLEEVLQSMLCPVSGCWGLHGCHYAYYYDSDCECHAMEVWPTAIDEPDQHDGNGHQRTERGLLYELAEFEFSDMVKELPLEHFHFSQRRQIFEIGWKEDGQDMELRVHIEPEDVNRE